DHRADQHLDQRHAGLLTPDSFRDAQVHRCTLGSMHRHAWPGCPYPDLISLAVRTKERLGLQAALAPVAACGTTTPIVTGGDGAGEAQSAAGALGDREGIAGGCRDRQGPAV